MKKRTMIIAMIALAALLLAGCKVNFVTDINTDGTGTTGFEFGFSEQEEAMLQAMQATTGTTPDLCSELTTELGSEPGASIEEEKRGDETWCVVSMPFENLEELRSIYETQFDADIQRLEMTEDEKFYYDISMDMTDADTSQITAMGVLLDMAWKLTLPGSIGTNNADEKSGSTLTWDMVPGQSHQFTAESSPGGGIPTWLIIAGAVCLGFLVLVVIGVIVFFIVRRSKKQPAA